MHNDNEKTTDIDPHFFSVVLSLSSAAMQQMGKLPNPLTQKVEKNLMQAQMSIEILAMLKRKTKGNLTPKEDQMLKNTLSDLQLNYADEAAKDEKSNKSEEKEAKEEKEEK